MKIDGRLLSRGFWLYIWEITSDSKRRLYVGRTGDNASPFAASPFKRIGQNLDSKPNAKANALYRLLQREEMICSECAFEMVAIGPIYAEQKTWEEHVPCRNKMAAIEGHAAQYLKARGYKVLGFHPPGKTDDCGNWKRVETLLADKFPIL